jgi:NSS family neurotransmitter:Na+ symporter
MEQKRSGFSGKLGFVLAAAGSAVGLGNIWRFPYLAAKYGGGMFLLVYIILAVTFGFSLMVAEICLGRKSQQSAITAFRQLDKRFSFLGYLAAAVPAIILPYYSVIGGWVTKYMSDFIVGKGTTAAQDGYFGNFISQVNEPLIYFLIFMALTVFIVLFGVEKGIEKVSKVMMPVLVILSIVIAIYSVTLPGAMEGVIYYIKPEFENFSITTVIAALGQLFYSMSLAMGIMITYGSYMKKNVNVETSTRQISAFDTGIAFFAGLMIIPAVFAFSGGDKSALGQGPGLMFVTLPKVFETMAGGQIIGAVFFLLVLLAALTSSISLTETVVASIMDKFRIKRIPACIIVLTSCIILGLVSIFGYSIWSEFTIIGMQLLDFFDFISNTVMMPILAIITCVFVGYFIKPKAIIDEVESNGVKFKSQKLFVVMIKYVSPIFILLILISSILNAFGVIKI